ncbi:radical SAM family heme chaperone HemW [Streptomyces sp. G45]|uniref:radical SAM family heme chaperone HemW n=1 Tax=Streptomyces sp. G45 TaxID=3406627 RepID=UPI003C23A576
METLTIERRREPEADALREDGGYVFHHPPKALWDRGVQPPPQSWGRYSVYLHVPFCKKICTFCTFERKRLRRDSLDGFIPRLWRELDTVEATDDLSAAALHSVYLGGGTASLLPNDAIAHFLDRLRGGFGLREDTEVTLESEPGTKTAEDLRIVRDAGVNRVSIGVQAFQDPLLKSLNRSHNAAEAVAMAEAVHAAGIENLHVDIMYGLPGQTMDMWRETVQRCLDLGVKHLSAYQMILFPDEVLSRMIRAGEVPPQPHPDVITEMRAYAVETFGRAGLPRYSLTEFAEPGFECRYVITTWDGSDYLGLGPGAYSRNGRQLWENHTVHAAYHRDADNGRRPVGRAVEMTPRQTLERDLAMGLCMLHVQPEELAHRAGIGLDSVDSVLRDLTELGLIRAEGSQLRLTEPGVRYATEVMKRLTVSQF